MKTVGFHDASPTPPLHRRSVASDRIADAVGRVRRWSYLLVAMGVSLGLGVDVSGSGTVTNADLGSLNKALAGGGTVVCAFDGTITLTNTLTIAQDTALDGTGHQVALDGNNQVQLFLVHTNVTLTLVHLTLTHGVASGPSTNGTPGIPGRGGAIENDGGVVAAQSCTFATNSALGGESQAVGGTGGDGLGGDIFNNAGTLNLTNVAFLGSQAACLSTQSVGGKAGGGSIFNDSGTVNLVGCSFAGCQAAIGNISEMGQVQGTCYGGVVFSQDGTLTASNCLFSANMCIYWEGPFRTQSSTVNGGALYVEGGQASITGSAFINNQAVAGGAPGRMTVNVFGGAIFNSGCMSLTQCVLASNRCLGGQAYERNIDTTAVFPGDACGGAVLNVGTLAAMDTLFSSNRVNGGIVIRDSEFALPLECGDGRGGAICTSNKVDLTRCSFVGNQAVGGSSPSVYSPTVKFGAGKGGAIYAGAGRLSMTNVTLATNRVTAGPGADALGGGLCAEDTIVELTDLTIANNQVLENSELAGAYVPTNALLGKAAGGGLYCSTNGTLTLQNSILADNLVNTTNSSPGNAYGPIIDGANNISSDASCGFTNATSRNNTDPILGPLGDYGGPTPTMPLLAGSPAIDHGNDAVAPATDQRGHPRPFGTHSDIGAFESSPPYTVRGQVTSFSPITSAVIATGILFTNPNADGTFEFDGLASGNYTVTPTLTNYVFAPSARTVTVGPDVLGLSFQAYHLTQQLVTNADLNDLNAALAGIGTVVLAFDGTVTLTNTLVITRDTTIDGTGHHVTISGDLRVRIFQVASNATLTLKHLTLLFGRVAVPPTNATLGIPGLGAAIQNEGGVVDVEDCEFDFNMAVGGASHIALGVNGAALGGDIYNGGGVLNVSNTVFSQSVAQGAGDAGGSGTGGLAAGGSIFNEGGAVNLVNCTWLSCRATGGPLFLEGSYTAPGDSLGGALYTRGGSLKCWNCIFATNLVSQNTGALSYIRGGTIAGGSVFIESGTASLVACRFLNNQAQGGAAVAGSDGLGGGIYNAGFITLSNCVLDANYCSGGGSLNEATGGVPPGVNAGRGGAVFNAGSLLAMGSVFRNNLATRGALDRVSGPGGAGLGGGIYSSHTLSLANCCFVGNQAIGGDGGGYEPVDAGGDGNGGAIYAETGSVGATNVTFAGNLSQGGTGAARGGGAGGDGRGAGLFVATANVEAVNVTLANNLAQGGEGGLNLMVGTNGPAQYGQSGNGFGAGIYCSTNGRVTLLDTIVANNLGGGNAWGVILDGGNNLSSDASCNFTNATSFNNTDPILGPLDNYGGPTLTMPLLAGSPAIDHGNDTVAPVTDQRGHPRPFGAHSDIGAFESSPPYTIRGRITSFWMLTNINVAASNLTTTAGTDGRFTFDGLTAGSYTVTPAFTNYLFGPASQTVMIGPDVVGLDFKAYLFNGLTPEPSTNGLANLILAGQAGQTWQIESATSLGTWQTLTNGTLPASGLLEFATPLTNPIRFYRAKQQ